MEDRVRRVTLLGLLLLLGAGMRLGLGVVNPPSNSYDNQLTPIVLYAQQGERPAPDACWQCYHPPVYYAASAVVLKGTASLVETARATWESVQLLNALASIVTLLCCFLLLRLYLPEDWLAQASGIALVAVLPRDLYTAASMGHDAFLEMFVSVAVLCFAYVERGRHERLALGGVLVSVVLGAWTKQSGLVLLALVVVIGWQLWRKADTDRRRAWILAAVGSVCLLALADEAWRTLQTGIPLASNQHFGFEQYVEGQPPGRISFSTFTTLLPLQLLEHPVLHPSTVDSFWTQLFARTWFDYEPRFLPPRPAVHWIARVLYVVGFGVTVVAGRGLLRVLRSGPHSARTLLLVPCGFVGAAIVQTVRFPYFSSMKALFVLPAVSVGALFFAYGIHELRSRPWAQRAIVGLVALLLIAGVVHWGGAMALNAEALGRPTSPQWPIPGLGPEARP